jgi:hypothetical protein
VDSEKSRSPEVIWDHPSFGRTCGGNPSSSGEGAPGGTSTQKVETPEARRSESRRYAKGHLSIDRELYVSCSEASVEN